MNSDIHVFDIGNNAIYFCIGNDIDPLIFETFFFKHGSLLKGNQYPFKIESKNKFMDEWSMAINIKKSDISGFWMPDIDDISIQSFHHEPIFGGDFQQINFRMNHDKTCWLDGLFFSRSRRFKTKIFFKGNDHPFFIKPEVELKSRYFKIKNNFLPVIISIYFEDKTIQMIKYPVNKFFEFDKKIQTMIITDTLSNDWKFSIS